MENVILLRYGEIHLKGQNRPYFERVLQSNIEKALEAYKDVRVIKAQGRYIIENVVDDPRIYVTKSRNFGIISFSPALRVAKKMEDIQEAAELQLKDAIDAQGGLNGLSFKVESRRSDKTFPLTSMELSRTIGAHLMRKFPGIKVDVQNPMVTIYIEVREWTYMYHRIIPGAGGMPVGTNGKAVLLLSGGIDSPVAGWMISKRGVELTAVHFHSFPYTSDRSKEKVIDLCRILTGYCGPIRLYVVPFTRIQQELYQKCPDKMLTLLMRRFMMKIGEIIARREEAGVLITGESLGQVASQTLESLSVTDDAVSMPVLRPLIGMDKIEIIDMAKKIDTYETSILPYEDCFTIFVPKHPLTRPRLDKVREAEALVDGKELIEDAVANAEVIEVKE